MSARDLSIELQRDAALERRRRAKVLVDRAARALVDRLPLAAALGDAAMAELREAEAELARINEQENTA